MVKKEAYKAQYEEKKLISMVKALFFRKKNLILILFFLILAFFFRDRIIEAFILLTDREKTAEFIKGFGPLSPLVFILSQILQVVFAPVPGEATGFIGGYLFGVWPGFIYSSTGLCAGSVINFAMGRWFSSGRGGKIIPVKIRERLDRMVKGSGILVILMLFILPGFPKDYLCIFLGLSKLPLRVFLPVATFGRMPGTMMLSVQGASLQDGKYGHMAIAAGVSILLLIGGILLKNYLRNKKKQG